MFAPITAFATRKLLEHLFQGFSDLLQAARLRQQDADAQGGRPVTVYRCNAPRQHQNRELDPDASQLFYNLQTVLFGHAVVGNHDVNGLRRHGMASAFRIANGSHLPSMELKRERQRMGKGKVVVQEEQMAVSHTG
jgi:hypothetical protein